MDIVEKLKFCLGANIAPGQQTTNEAYLEIMRLRNDLICEHENHGTTIDDRDHWESNATELAELVGKFFSMSVGEHSSGNCPVQNAISILESEGE